MNKTGWMGVIIVIYGIIALMASTEIRFEVWMSLFMILTGIALIFLGEDIEKAKEAK